MTEDIKQLIKRFKENSMTKEDQKILEQYIASGRLEISDFEGLQNISDSLDNLMVTETSKTMDMKFYTMLGEEKAKNERKDWLKNWFGRLPLAIQYALPVALLMIGITVGMQINNNKLPQDQYNNIPQLMSSVIQGTSTSDRMMAVKETVNASVSEIDIINVLIFSLNNDKSDNVRIATIEALLKYAEVEEVRKGLIDAVRHQTSPIVVMNIAQALKMIGSEIPIDQYKNMLNSELPSEAVAQIEEGLKII